MSNTEKLTYTVEEMAAALGIGRSKAYELIHRADFPKIQMGRIVRIPIEPLKEWVHRQAETSGGNEIERDARNTVVL